MISIKTEPEIQKMRTAGQIAANVLSKLADATVPGVSTYDLDQLGKQLIESFGAQSACYRYKSGLKVFPAYTCISVNNEVVHGIGVKTRLVQPGDIVSLDVCVFYNGFVGDNARTVLVGSVRPDVAHMVNQTEAALYKGIDQVKPGNRLGDVSAAIQKHVETAGFSIVRDFVGHGVGRSMHEEPQIPNFGLPGTGPKLRAGMTLAIEPMVNLGSSAVRYDKDGWTVVTQDGSASAHFEHTVLVTASGAEILTLPGGG